MWDPIEPGTPLRALLEPGERLLWHSQPGPHGLFLSVLPRLLRDLIFLALASAALFPGWSQTNDGARTAVILLVLFLLWSLFREIREATAARVSHYLVTDRRLLVILPRGTDGTRSYPHGRLATALDSGGGGGQSLPSPGPPATARFAAGAPVSACRSAAMSRSAGIPRERAIAAGT